MMLLHLRYFITQFVKTHFSYFHEIYAAKLADCVQFVLVFQALLKAGHLQVLKTFSRYHLCLS